MMGAQRRRQTVYTSCEWQERMIREVKGPVVAAVECLMNPEAGYGEKARRLLSLRRALMAFKEFPEPVKGNTWHPNSHVLIEIRDEFFRHCRLGEGRNTLFRLFINFIIILYDYDPPYRMMIDWWAFHLKLRNWNYDTPVRVHGRLWGWWAE
jgi:hypothetical protein